MSIAEALEMVKNASWNDTPAAFLLYSNLITENNNLDLATEIAKVEAIENVKGQAEHG